MSEERNEAGQFTPSTEPLFGREAELAEAGYKPMPDPEKEKPEVEFATAKEAAEALGVPAQEPAEPIIYYDVATGEPTDPNEAITVEQAARDLTAWWSNKGAFDAKSVSNDFAAEVDKMRADALKQNPKLAEQYGIEPPDVDSGKVTEPKPDRAANNKSADEAAIDDGGEAIDAIDGLDPETRKALKLPQVRQALEQQFSEADKVRESYSTALSHAQSFAQASFLEGFPELSGLPVEQLEQGLALLAQVNPPRFNAAMNVLNRVQSIQQAQQQDQYQRAYASHQQFEAYGKSEDAKFRAMLDNDPGKVRAASTEVVSYLAEIGIGQDRLVHLLRTDPMVRSAEGQKILADAAKFHALRKSADGWRPAKPVPTVQRPGVAAPRGSHESGEVSKAQAAFDKNPTQKTGAALLSAQYRARAARG